MPRTLHLIKHGQPSIVPGVPAHEWELAADALSDLSALTGKLSPAPQLVVCSEEPKAKATAQALASAWGVPLRPMLGLHEQLRYTSPFHADERDFQAEMARFFALPDEVVSGEERADDARLRFTNAVNAVMLANAQDSIAIVAHGTVISLYVARANGLDPLPLWSALKLLDAVTLDWPTLKRRS